MDSAMDITNSLRPEDISKGDFFDFVVTSDAADTGSIHSFGRSMKSLGIYLEAYETNNNNTSSNNNNNSTSNNNNSGSNRKEDGDRLHMVEQNNNLMIANGSGNQDYLVHSPYWNGPAITGKEDPGARWESSVLEDLNCWSQDGSGSSKHLTEGENTDGAIYTLTVLNGSDQSSSWYRLPDSVQDDDSPSPHPQGVAPSHVQGGSIDLDSLINNIIPSPLHQASASTFTFHPSTTAQPQDVQQPPQGSETTSDQQQPATIKNEFAYDESGFAEGHQMQQSFGSSSNTQPANSLATSMVGTSSASTSSVVPGSPINSNTDWGGLGGAATSSPGVDSLLRSALQGKSSVSTFSRYNGGAVAHNQPPMKVEKCGGDKEPELNYQDVIGNVKTHSPVMCAVSLETGAVVMLDGNASSGSMLMDSDNTHSVDDIFLSHLDSVTYEEDYEKLKSIEHEVANSMEQYCNPYLTSHMGGEHVRMSPLPHMDHTITLNPLPSTTTSTSTVTPSKSAKKYKRSTSSSSSKSSQNHQGQIQTPGVSSAGSSSSSTGGGIRKERSLHYCNICSKGFKDKYSVNVHIRTHTGEKPFTCTLCGKSFRQKAHLAKHYHTHLAQAKNPTTGGCSSSGSKPSSSKSR